MKKTMFYLFLFIDVVLLSLFICAHYSMASEIIDTDTIYWDWHGPTPENNGYDAGDDFKNVLNPSYQPPPTTNTVSTMDADVYGWPIGAYGYIDSSGQAITGVSSTGKSRISAQ